MTLRSDTDKLPSLKPLLFLSLGLALWIDFSSLHEMDNADALVPILMSLYKWTPFYWDQDRFGMLVPLLAMPVRHPFWNLQLQWYLNIFAGVFSFILAARYLFPVREWPLVALSGLGLYFALTFLEFRFHYFGSEPYGVGMALGFAVLLLAPKHFFLTWRLAISCLLMVVAHWVNIGLALILIPVLVALIAAQRWERAAQNRAEHSTPSSGSPRADPAPYGVGLVVAVIGALGGLLIKQFCATQRTTIGFSSVSSWPWGWRTLFQGIVYGLSQFWWSLIVIACIGLIVLYKLRRQDGVKNWLLRPLLLIVASVAYFLLVGTSAWVEDNAYSPRYLNPAVLIFEISALALLVLPLASFLGSRMMRRLILAAAAMVIGTTLTGFGLPLLSRVRALVSQIDPIAADVLAARCTHVAGEYWTVWPTVYHASLALFERGDRRPIYGLTGRSRPTLDAAKAVPIEQMRIALLPTPDQEGERWLRTYAFPPMNVIDRRSTVVVLEPVRTNASNP